MNSIQYHLSQCSPAEMDWKQLNLLIGPTNSALALNDEKLSAVPKAHVLLSRLISLEAVRLKSYTKLYPTTQEKMSEKSLRPSAGQPKQDFSQTLLFNSPDLNDLLLSLLSKWDLDQMPGKLSSYKMRELIQGLCFDRWVTLWELGHVLDREQKSSQDQYLTPMIVEGVLEHRFPETSNHQAQAYRTRT